MSIPFVFFFDIDGTLLSSGGAGKRALEEALLHEFSLEGIRKDVPYSGRTDVAIVKELLQSHGIPAHDDHVRRLQESYLERLPAALNELQGNVLPGVVRLLNAIQGTPHLTGLLTGNIRRGASVKLGHFGIDHYFPFGGFGDGVDTRDEVARAAWDEASRHHEGTLSPGRTWVIGDTPLDVACARHIGVNVLAVATGLHSMDELARCQPDLVAASLDEEGLLERMTTGAQGAR